MMEMRCNRDDWGPYNIVDDHVALHRRTNLCLEEYCDPTAERARVPCRTYMEARWF
jgi:hypothetical protein